MICRDFCPPLVGCPVLSDVDDDRQHHQNPHNHDNSGFQLSPDFRQRASSNASSVGRLSPIPSVLGIEPDWFDPREDFMATAHNDTNNATNPITASTSSLVNATQIDQANLENLEAVAAGEDTLDAANLSALDALAGALADDLSLRSEFLLGSVFI